jgi:Leucine-rich repeat (LRR) protein
MVVEQERRYKYENVCFEKQEAKQLSIINLNRQNNHLWLTYSGCNVKRSIAIDNYENLRKVVSCLDSNIKGFEKCVFCSDTKQQQSENLKDHIAICSTRLRDLTPEIEIYNCPLLEEIDLTGQQVPDLKITNCPNLKILKIKDSKITSLDLRNIPSLLEVETNPQCQVYFHPAYTDHQIAQQRERLINLEKE